MILDEVLNYVFIKSLEPRKSSKIKKIADCIKVMLYFTVTNS